MNKVKSFTAFTPIPVFFRFFQRIISLFLNGITTESLRQPLPLLLGVACKSGFGSVRLRGSPAPRQFRFGSSATSNPQRLAPLKILSFITPDGFSPSGFFLQGFRRWPASFARPLFSFPLRINGNPVYGKISKQAYFSRIQ